MKLADRVFTTTHAEPGPRPLWIGLFSPSGAGKTFSALRLAKGIQSVIGGKIELIDTESGRGKHYAEMFDYEYTAFPPPHSSLDYLAAINHAVKTNRSRIIIIDQMSFEHDGEGGLTDFHEAEVQRMSGGDAAKADRVNMLAWAKPKAARKTLLRGMLAYGNDAVFILCFRADEQSKPGKDEVTGKSKVISMGFMPIAGKPFVYEATLCALLLPGADGVPTWNPENVGERMMRKLPQQFKDMFDKTKGKALSEDHGRKIAEWAQGGATSKAAQRPTEEAPKRQDDSLTARVAAFEASIKERNTQAGVAQAWKAAGKLLEDIESAEDSKLIDRMTHAKESRLAELREEAL